MPTKVIKTEILRREQLTSMCDAMEKIPSIIITKAEIGVVASVGKTEIFRAMRGPASCIIRRINGLFSCDGVPDETVKKIRKFVYDAGGIQHVKGGAAIE